MQDDLAKRAGAVAVDGSMAGFSSEKYSTRDTTE